MGKIGIIQTVRSLMGQAPASKRASARKKARPKKKLTASQKQGRKRLIRYGIYACIGLIASTGLAGFIYWRSLYFGMPDLPETQAMWTSGRTPAIEFVSEDGTTLAIRGPRYGRLVRVADLPPHVPQAFISAEDKRFYEHDGADTKAIARAAWSNWRSGRTVSGASTITQQLIKNLVLTPKQTLRRKAQEVRLARELELRLSKDEILELYLNRVYFGSGAYGLDAAAQHYFGKQPAELTLAEVTLLASVLKAPSRMALDEDLSLAKARQLYVLGQMLEADFITDEERDAAIAEEIILAERPPEDQQLGYILDTVSDHVSRMLPSPPGDIVVTVTIDPELQTAVHGALLEKMEAQGPDLKASQASAILMRPGGAIIAMVGGLDYETSQFNRATQARRQPGSSFKAFVYAAALETGIDPYDVRDDLPVTFGDWSPQNYSGGNIGPVTLSEAFAKSLNTVAAGLGQEVGEDRIIRLATRFGIRSDLRPLPSIALGSQEVTLFELTRAFGAFAKGGVKLDPYFIVKIEDSRGNVLFERPDYNEVIVYPEPLAKQMNAMMARVVLTGTGRRAQVPGWTVAGKTGTSQDWRDAWFIGYTSSLVGGVWVGNDDDTSMDHVTGGGLPADLWSDIVTIALSAEDPVALAGAENLILLSEASERRLAFYRSMSGAFRAVEERTIADTGTGTPPQ